MADTQNPDALIDRMEDEADPQRCQAVTSKGQCINKGAVLEGDERATFCRVHGGNMQQAQFKAEKLKTYRLAKWQQRLLEHHSDNPNIICIRDEIGILRVMLEAELQKCGDITELMLRNAIITDLILKIEKLVLSCHKLEGSLGQLVDKKMILQFAHQVIDVIGKAPGITPAASNFIAEKILEILPRLTSEEEK